LLKLYQIISPGPRLCQMFLNMVIFLRWGVVSTSPNPQAGGPPLVCCPRLHIRIFECDSDAVNPQFPINRLDFVMVTVRYMWIYKYYFEELQALNLTLSALSRAPARAGYRHTRNTLRPLRCPSLKKSLLFIPQQIKFNLFDVVKLI
jgi:hypothetical protein